MSQRSSPCPLAGGADWYKDAIIYELRVRSFADGDGDGAGDFRGLTEKLGYLQDLGVTALWLLPFYPSPLRDDGYDISDYVGVHPEYGTLADFDRFMSEAHRRGLRVITELVLNHSSDQHPWFQRARRAPPGSVEREFYVWSETPERYRDARIIFPDYEPSNWSYDPVARAYYWHRFYAHQPDLNYDRPEVRAAMLEVCSYWLDKGVDGLRLDAVPYLFEREGTSCESLPETHAFLRELRAHIDARYEGRMLLAEANQWPEDAVAYFGAGDECHMAFHFPVMPRIFVAIHLEDRFPLTDILVQTPEIPASCQWALFLRNHDELTLEMVTDEERDVMVEAYAAEPAMRVNLGIRRRLAPLAGNQRRHIELMNALLFSLPGTPVLYYGDEIGMGDNVYLGDRNGVRTPMQWSADKNAGFSRANPQRLVLPVIIDPDYHYESVNVEAQQRAPGSLLWWTKRLVALRKRHPAFGRGSLELLRPDNPHVLAFVRRYDDEAILVVANLSRFVEPVELDLSAFRGAVPVELFGRRALPPVGDGPYPLTLPGHGFYWLALTPRARAEARAAAYEPPALDAAPAWPPGPDGEIARLLAGWATAQAWFTGRRRRVEEARIVVVVAAPDPPGACLVVLEIAYEEGGAERYLLAPAVAEGTRAAEIRARSREAVVGLVPVGEGGILFDALADPPSARALLEAIFAAGRVEGRAGTVTAWAGPGLPVGDGAPRSVPTPSPGASILFGERVFLDLRRRLDDTSSPGLWRDRLLAQQGRPAPVVPLAGAIELSDHRPEPLTLAVVRGFVESEGDLFAHAAGEARRFFEQVLARGDEEPAPPSSMWDPDRIVAEEPPILVRDAIGAFLDTARLLGRRAADLHLALAEGLREPFTPNDRRRLYQSLRNQAGRALRELGSAVRFLPTEIAPLAARVLGRQEEAMRRLGAILGLRLSGPRVRHLGPISLGQVLLTGHELVLADLEGDRTRPAAERRRLGSPVRDIAGLCRSLHEAVFSTLLDPARVRPEDVAAAHPWASVFWTGAAAAMVQAYAAPARAGGLLPPEPRELAVLLDAFLLDAAFAGLAASLGAAEPGPRAVALELLAAVLEGPGERGPS